MTIEIEWQDYDVIVVGSGGSGGQAARAAADAGANVLSVSKDPIGASDTKISEGIAAVRGSGADDDTEEVLSENLKMAGGDLPVRAITDAFAKDSTSAYDRYRTQGLRPTIKEDGSGPEARPLPFGGHTRRRSVGHKNSGIAFGHASWNAVVQGTLNAALTIDGERIVIDYDGSSPASPYGINLVMNYTLAYTAFGVRAAVAPEIPNNAGSLAPVEVRAPLGSILNVEKPRPVSARHIIGQFLPDVVLGCLAKVPGLEVPAEGAACLWGIQVRGGPEIGAAPGMNRDSDAAAFDLLSFNSGGSGARPAVDGLSATAFPSGVRALPVEAVETRAPVVVWRKELRPDSGGAGRQRGGLGQTVELGTRDGAPFALFAMYDRVENPAKGRNGGTDGAAGRVGTANGAALRPKGKQIVGAGDRVRVDLPGGGGHGDPHERPLEAIAEDIAEGYVTAEAAQALYGVSVRDDGTVTR